MNGDEVRVIAFGDEIQTSAGLRMALRVVEAREVMVSIQDQWFQLGAVLAALNALADSNASIVVQINPPALGRALLAENVVIPSEIDGAYSRGPRLVEFMTRVSQGQVEYAERRKHPGPTGAA